MPLTLTDKVRSDLHIRSNSNDLLISETIDTAKMRIRMMGVQLVSDADPTTVQCIKLYCRFYFNFQGEADRYFRAFEYMANAMAESGDYRKPEEGR